MPITIAFTTTALVALIFNVVFLRRSIQQKQALIRAGENGKMKIIANTFIQVWATIFIGDIVVIAAGFGILTGNREWGYLLALMPVGSVFVGVFAIRGF